MTLDLIKKGEKFLINKFIIDGEEKSEFTGLTIGEMVTLTNIITFRNTTFLCLQNDKYAYLINMDCASNIYGELVNNNEKDTNIRSNDLANNVSEVLIKRIK